MQIDIPDGNRGAWSVESFTVQPDELSQRLSLMKYGRGVPAGSYKRLRRNGHVVMSNTPDEIQDFAYFVHKATGDVLINGLGLGVVVKALLEKPEITSITVIEKDADVIALVATHLSDPRLVVIHADAFAYKPTRNYDAVWHDIWDDICSDNLPEMSKLHRKYGRHAKYQESWCRDRCESQKWKGR